jgi:tetratricopeptide (TPR) repeat protein
LIIGAVVAAMLAAPAAVIVWGFDQHRRYGAERHRIRQRGKLMDRFGASAELRLRQARALARAGQRGEARAELDRLLKDHPRHLGGLLARARLAAGDKDHASALRYSNRALLVAQRSGTARLLVAHAHLALGRPDRAETTLRAGLALEPRAAPQALLLARILADAHRNSEARDVLQQALRHARDEAAKTLLQESLDRLGGAPP